MPMLASGVAMMTWQHPSSAALPAKQRPDTMPTRGTTPAQPAEQREGLGVEPRHDRHVRVARAPAPALGEEHHREPQPLHELEEAVLLAVVHLALGAGQDRIVVRQHGAARPFLVEEVTVDPPDAGHEAVGRRVGDEVLGAAARPLGGDRPARRTPRSCPGRRGPRCSPAPSAAHRRAGARWRRTVPDRAWRPRGPAARPARGARPPAGSASTRARTVLVAQGRRSRPSRVIRDEHVPGLHGIAGCHQARRRSRPPWRPPPRAPSSWTRARRGRPRPPPGRPPPPEPAGRCPRTT